MNKDFCINLRRKPDAVSLIKGSSKYPDIVGKTEFYTVKNGILVRTEINGLPKGSGLCDYPIFAFHIHSGNLCSGDEKDSFAKAGTHYNPQNCPHPYHAGDMPPLFGVNGRAFSEFLTDRFKISEIIGRTVIVHSSPDDFKTQPSGNAGEKIACGIIIRAQ